MEVKLEETGDPRYGLQIIASLVLVCLGFVRLVYALVPLNTSFELPIVAGVIQIVLAAGLVMRRGAHPLTWWTVGVVAAFLHAPFKAALEPDRAGLSWFLWGCWGLMTLSLIVLVSVKPRAQAQTPS
jgi:hypothetical protein